jgi:hypothetical protein
LGTTRQIILHPPFTIAAPESMMPAPSEKLKIPQAGQPVEKIKTMATKPKAKAPAPKKPAPKKKK